jgi:hypothetical protein
MESALTNHLPSQSGKLAKIAKCPEDRSLVKGVVAGGVAHRTRRPLCGTPQ